ncbi:MAG: hypothetical protein JWM85_351 [Acidimicrobiaceae bacterium]|nr:hypothetical protein [Acidimicrobiaceae bacterium]
MCCQHRDKLTDDRAWLRIFKDVSKADRLRYRRASWRYRYSSFASGAVYFAVGGEVAGLIALAFRIEALVGLVFVWTVATVIAPLAWFAARMDEPVATFDENLKIGVYPPRD